MSDSGEPVVWIGEGRSAREDAARALAEWARARGVRLTPLGDIATPASPGPKIDLELADKVEKEIDRGREALSSNNADEAERALARADAILREHPELPQAAWLRAECERAWAQRFLRAPPRDEARARIAWENAQALDDGRVAGIGETSFPPRPKVETAIALRAAHPERITLRLDGRVLKPTESTSHGALYKLEVSPAEHHLYATTESGRVVFASWIAIMQSSAATLTSPTTSIAVSEGGSCSREDFASVQQGAGGRVLAEGVTCDQWIAAIPTPDRPNSVLVARCERDVCGPLLEWRVERLTAAPPQSLTKTSHWPAWATWTLVGIGAGAAASAALVATGVFESRPVEPRFVVGGARQN